MEPPATQLRPVHHPADHTLALPPLPAPIRIALLVVGSFFVGLGILGLFLPFLQGILFLAVGAALLSLASDSVHRFVSRLLRRWPRMQERMHRFRQHWHSRLHRRR
jgi:uncharacterized membrane protein YbaN (DUF454 family)